MIGWPPLRTISAALWVALLCATDVCTCVAADAAASSGVASAVRSEVQGADVRLRTVLYSPDTVYDLPGRVGYEIDLQFEAGEHFVGVGVGDVAGLSFMAAGDHLFVKPRAPEVHTDLTVLTSRRIYHFSYQTQSHAAGDGGDVVYAIRFLYPRVTATAGAAAGRDVVRGPSVQSELVRADAGLHRNLDYWYCGPPELRPLSAWDDGVQTHLRFAASAELPAVFVSERDGGESLVNFHVEQDEIVVHRIAWRFVLRRGRLVGCVVNRSFAGGGLTLPTETISPGVQRHVRGGVDATGP